MNTYRTALVMCLLATAAPWARVPTPSRCAAAKERAVAHKAGGLLGCEADAAASEQATDPNCTARVRAKFEATWTRIEARGACRTVGDAVTIEAKVDAFVAEVTLALNPTTTTTTPTTSSSCPPATAFYCNYNVFRCSLVGPPSFCPSGTACSGDNASCTCVGDSIPCGDPRLRTLNGAFCQWGTCPAGMTCGSIPIEGQCLTDCACH